MDERQLALVKLIVQCVMALTLFLAMTWIVLSPTTSDASSKAALVIVSSAVGFLFGKNT